MSDCIELFRYIHIFKLLKLLTRDELWKASIHSIYPNSRFDYNDEIWITMDSLQLSNYYISTYGRVKNLKNHILSSFPNEENYQRIRLQKNNNGSISTCIHTLMVRLLLKCDDNITTDHINKNRSDNHISNLRPATKKQQRENTTPVLNHQGQYVYQYDINYILIKKWDTITNVSENLPCNKQCLSRACKNKKLFKNYYWSFDDVDPNEIWVSSKDIYPEYEEFLTSSLGKLKRISSGHITYGFKRGGYISVKVVDKLTGKHIAKQMHVLILSCFIGRQDNMEVNHKDGVKDNNNITNLEYTTSSENTIHAIGLGLIDFSKRNPYKVKVIQLSLDNIYIAEYKSIKEASQYIRYKRIIYIMCM